MKCWATALATLAVLPASLALAEELKTIDGRVYKDVAVSRVEADGIVLRTKTGISKIYFIELPKDVQVRFHYTAATTVAEQREPELMKAEAKQDESWPPTEGGWSAALGVPVVYLRLVAVGALTTTGLVLAFIRSRFS